MDRLVISNTPHVRANSSSRRIMLDVIIALMPTFLASIIFFGFDALLVVLTAEFFAVAAEVVYRLIAKENIKLIIKTFDFTSAVTGLILGLSLGSHVPLIAPALGSTFAVVVVKMLFGGTGKNLVNPAVAGRVFVFMSFSAVVKGFVEPRIGAISPTEDGYSLLDLFLGTGLSGCLGETSKLCLIIGGVYLVIRGVIKWYAPVITIVAAGLSFALYKWDIAAFLPSVLSGGLIFGAIFMATDYVTTPNTFIGNIVYFTALGLLTGLMRGIYQGEVLSYCILFMNLFVPIIDRLIYPKPFGYEKPKKEAKSG